jgi:hypothetical protein
MLRIAAPDDARRRREYHEAIAGPSSFETPLARLLRMRSKVLLPD